MYSNIKNGGYGYMSETDFSKIKLLLVVLFILTITSLWFGLGTSMFLGEIANIHSSLFTKHMWGMWFWLPIPILSIILGIKYKKRGVKCTKNIVAGFIIGILLLIYGSFSFIFNFEVDYSEIYNYEQIVGLEIPSKGVFMKQKWDESYLFEHVTNYAKFTDVKETEKFGEEIKDSKNWILKEEISSNLGIFIPKSMFLDPNDICYYLVYIEGINDYNTIPDKTGKYHVYAMMYNVRISTLAIEEYIFEYKI